MSEFSYPTHVPQEGGRASYGDKVATTFYTRSVLMPHKSRESGLPVYEPVDYVKFQQRGSADETHLTVVNFLANFEDPETREAYETRYDRFKRDRSDEQIEGGTPLAVLFVEAPHVVDTCRTLKVTTVQQLARLSEEGIRKLGMGGRKHVDRAQRFIEAGERGMPSHEVEMKLEAQTRQIEELKALLEARTAPEPMPAPAGAKQLKPHGAPA